MREGNRGGGAALARRLPEAADGSVAAVLVYGSHLDRARPAVGSAWGMVVAVVEYRRLQPPPGRRDDRPPMPPHPEPAIRGDQEVILYLHGHSSRLEEALELTGRIHEAAARAGRKYTVISMDLPCCGYASHLDHERIAPPEASRYHLSGDGGGYPILEFVEEFVVRFVETLDRTVGVRGRIASVVGGSLGGNLVLRLGERRPAPPWLRALVSWSPASVWDALVYDAIKDRVTEVPRGEMVEPETEDRRREYFGNVFEGLFHLVAVGPQWESW